jgi:hypothetical protein
VSARHDAIISKYVAAKSEVGAGNSKPAAPTTNDLSFNIFESNIIINHTHNKNGVEMKQHSLTLHIGNTSCLQLNEQNKPKIQTHHIQTICKMKSSIAIIITSLLIRSTFAGTNKTLAPTPGVRRPTPMPSPLTTPPPTEGAASYVPTYIVTTLEPVPNNTLAPSPPTPITSPPVPTPYAPEMSMNYYGIIDHFPSGKSSSSDGSSGKSGKGSGKSRKGSGKSGKGTIILQIICYASNLQFVIILLTYHSLT